MKRILNFAIVFLSLVASAHDFNDGTFAYDVKDSVSVIVFALDRQTISGDVIIPDHVTYNGKEYIVKKIGKKAFYYSQNVTNIYIPNTVTTIDNYAFYGCGAMKTITIPVSVHTVGSQVFSSLRTVYWNAKHTSGALDAFSSNSRVDKIVFGNTVEVIPSYICNNFKNITTVTIPNSVKTIGMNAFSGCSNLMTVVIGNSVTTINDNAFQDCRCLYNIKIPNSVTSIGQYAFNNCGGLKTVTLGKSLTFLGNNCFNGCENLKTIICKPQTPPTATDCFMPIHSVSVTLTVPTGCADAYKNSDDWKRLLFVEEKEFLYLEGDINDDEKVDGVDLNNLINHILGNDLWPNADLNHNGSIDGTDLNQMINTILGQ